jgi:hypothetical protein
MRSMAATRQLGFRGASHLRRSHFVEAEDPGREWARVSGLVVV